MRSRSLPRRAGALALLAVVPAACGLDGLSGGPVDAGAGGDAADAGAVDDGQPIFLPDGAPDCAVHADGKLHCTNTLGAALYALPTYTSAVVDHLATKYSAFDCWGTGDKHAGNNTTWYRTFGDDNVDHPRQGWVAGVDLSTPDLFDANPTAFGLAHCP